jgi:glucokinase
MSTIAIDMGGTNIRAARIEDGKVISQQAVSCHATGSEDEVMNQIIQLIESVNASDVTKIGIGVPSVVDSRKGIVYDLQNIPSWKEVHVKETLEKHFGLETLVDNDVNCFALGEKHFGAGKPYENIVAITLGTGVGAGIIIDGKIYGGSNTGAGEIGCLPWRDADYEHYCSSHFFNDHATEGAVENEKAMRGDASALALWSEFGANVGKLLQVILFAYDPEAIIIGGGIASSAQFFSASMLQSMKDGFPYQHEVERVKVIFSTLKHGNLLGASVL